MFAKLMRGTILFAAGVSFIPSIRFYFDASRGVLMIGDSGSDMNIEFYSVTGIPDLVRPARICARTANT